MGAERERKTPQRKRLTLPAFLPSALSQAAEARTPGVRVGFSPTPVPLSTVQSLVEPSTTCLSGPLSSSATSSHLIQTLFSLPQPLQWPPTLSPSPTSTLGFSKPFCQNSSQRRSDNTEIKSPSHLLHQLPKAEKTTLSSWPRGPSLTARSLLLSLMQSFDRHSLKPHHSVFRHSSDNMDKKTPLISWNKVLVEGRRDSQ